MDNQVIKIKPNYLNAIISVTLVLVLIGFLGLLLVFSRQLVRHFQQNIELVVELSREVPKAEARHLKIVLEKQQYVLPNSVKFIGKEQAAEQLQGQMGIDFQELDLPNPLFDVITFNVKPTYINPDSLQVIVGRLRAESMIRDVFYQEELVGNLGRNVEKLALIALTLGIFFIFVAIYLIHNTVGLAIYSNRFILRNMELVGASWSFIRRPYLKRSMIHGLISGSVAVAVLIGIQQLIQRNFSEILVGVSPWAVWSIYFGILLLGMLITTVSTYLVLQQYLSMKEEQLY